MAHTAPKANWSLDDAPRLDGKIAVVTGGTGGLGYETALGLARSGATTILAGRNPDKGAQAVARIQGELTDPPARLTRVRFEMLDLASLASVARFAAAVSAAQGGVIDILVNNAGVMGLPARRLTEDGFERQIGVNYLAHFALTGRLKDALCAAPGGGRVVSVASLAHRRAGPGWADLQSEASYGPRRAYGRSKLAMLVFAIELQRRAVQNQWNLRSIAAHPGWARTDIIPNGLGDGGPNPGTWHPKAWLVEQVFGLVAQSAREGALPSLYAAMAPGAEGGAYYGPAGWGETRGTPGLSWVAPAASDAAAGSALWALSETLTGVAFGSNHAAPSDPRERSPAIA
jgi:NAD(P)-dependent dehydrogenase (short-subunit alcohol dehydrogenase family)